MSDLGALAEPGVARVRVEVLVYIVVLPLYGASVQSLVHGEDLFGVGVLAGASVVVLVYVCDPPLICVVG